MLEESININDSEKDDEIFFKAGQLLMFLYVFSVKNLRKENIKYLNGTFFLKLSNDKDKFISLSTKLLDIVNENSLIGINKKGEIETTWIKYIDEKLCPIGIESIYIAIYFSYIGKVTNNSYYSQSAKSSLIPLLHLSESDYKNIMNNNKILNSIYLLNEYMSCSELSNFFEFNPELLMIIPHSYKKACISKTDNLIFQCIIDNSMDVLKSVILT